MHAYRNQKTAGMIIPVLKKTQLKYKSITRDKKDIL